MRALSILIRAERVYLTVGSNLRLSRCSCCGTQITGADAIQANAVVAADGGGWKDDVIKLECIAEALKVPELARLIDVSRLHPSQQKAVTSLAY
jgi:hypothetical protein